MADKAVDMLGQEYGPGDFVVYATTKGRNPVLKYARVVKVQAISDTRQVWNSDRSYEIEEYTWFKVGVKELKNGRGFRRRDATPESGRLWDEQGMSKVRTTYPMYENIVKVSGAEAA